MSTTTAFAWSGVRDVPRGTPGRSLGHKPCICSHFKPLVKNAGEKCGPTENHFMPLDSGCLNPGLGHAKTAHIGKGLGCQGG